MLFALRQPPNLRGYIDGSLTFGMPAIAFAMQSRLVADIPFGRAYSAVAVSALYGTGARCGGEHRTCGRWPKRSSRSASSS